jgi:type I restriction-modification system DNA methylase subunit
VSIGKTDNGTKETFVDVTSIHADAGIRRGSSKVVFVSHAQSGAGEYSSKWVSYFSCRFAFNCVDKMGRVEGMTGYLDDGTRYFLKGGAMGNLNLPFNGASEAYTQMYETLAELRETFHRSGRLDDSNAKLDEVSKLFATYLSFRKGEIPYFPSAQAPFLIEELHRAFDAAARTPGLLLANGHSVFGRNLSLAIREGDEHLASQLVKLVRDGIDRAFSSKAEGQSFDVLNEAFGHFVRDNFRGNIEDAQYMTPPEVVNFMTELLMFDLEADLRSAKSARTPIVVVDPACGVGSFLAAFYERTRSTDWLSPRRIRLYGQDKVERMVRLSTINLQLFDVEEHRVTLGNSLEVGSALDSLNGKVDCILTNPPFGARFESGYVNQMCKENTPLFSNVNPVSATFDSELLFVDRNLKLLRDGGRMLIVVPDGVVSAKGAAALLRSHMSAVSSVEAVVELPAVTFAQAGTRTKTAVLYLRKGRSKSRHSVFMGISRDLGFQVTSRKGVQIKVADGLSDLPSLLETYKTSRSRGEIDAPTIVGTEPSAVLVPASSIQSGSWTPSHYSAARFSALSRIAKHSAYDLVPLRELVTFCSENRRPEKWREGWAYISILHLLGEGFVDIGGARAYSPKTPGIPTGPEELLLSRINPRIPRVCVTPDFGVKTLCSSEFEVMTAKRSVNIYALTYLLQSTAVQAQIQSLTSGTSASHNRIRTSELAHVLVPVPKLKTAQHQRLQVCTSQYRKALQSLYANTEILASLRKSDASLFV